MRLRAPVTRGKSVRSQYLVVLSGRNTTQQERRLIGVSPLKRLILLLRLVGFLAGLGCGLFSLFGGFIGYPACIANYECVEG